MRAGVSSGSTAWELMRGNTPHAGAASDSEPRNGPSLPRLRPGRPTGDPDPEEPPRRRQELIALQGGRSPPLPASSKVG